MYLSHQKEAVFLAIPKTASRTVSVWLRKDYQFFIKNGHHGIVENNRFSNYFHFAVVRNPFSRMVSRWYQRCLQLNSLPARSKFDLSVFKPRFKNYVNNLKKEHIKRKNLDLFCAYWLSPQSHWLNHAEYFVEEKIHIIKQEDLVKGLSELPFVDKAIDLKHIGKHEYGNWRDYYDQESIDKIVEFYWKDFEKFNYGTTI